MEHMSVKGQTETIHQPKVTILDFLINKYHHLNSPTIYLLHIAVPANTFIQGKLAKTFLKKEALNERYMLILLIYKYSKDFKLF